MNKTTPLQSINRLLIATGLQILSFIPNARLKKWTYQAALGVCDFKTINRLVEQKGLNLDDDNKSNAILMVAAAHRWVSNESKDYQCRSYALSWSSNPTHRPKLPAEFFAQLLDKALKNPPQSDRVQKSLLSDLQVITLSKNSLDLSANDTVLKKMNFSPTVLPFAVIKALVSYTATPLYVCERSTCDELLRRHFKDINWMTDLDPQSDAPQHKRRCAWKEIISSAPEPYVLSLLRNYKQIVKDPDFVNTLVMRDFSFTVWDSACNRGLGVERIREAIAALQAPAEKKDTVQKLLEFCDYRSAKQQRGLLIKNIDEVSSEPEVEPPQPRKRKM